MTTSTNPAGQRARCAPNHLTAAEVAEVLSGKHPASTVTSVVEAYALRGGLPGWRPGADGKPRADFKTIGHTLGIRHDTWVRQLDSWHAIQRAMGRG
jgi:hypothetical protein